MDKAILNKLIKNARLSMSGLGKELGEDPVKLSYRRKRMEEKGIIVGYATKLNIEKMNFEKIQIDFMLNNPQITKSIIKFFDSKQVCFFAYEMIGDFDLTIEMGIEGTEQLRKVLNEFKEKYFDEIRHYEVSDIYKECVSSWYPQEEKSQNVC